MATDFELLEGWRAGNRAAGSELFERYFDNVSRFFRNKVSEGVEDLIQKTFLTCVESRDKFRGEGSFRSYLFGVAHNVLRHHIRAKMRHGDKIDFGNQSIMDMAPGASTIIAKRKEQQLLLHALRHIPLDFQIALELYYWERMTANEIAEALEIPVGTARSRIRRGKEILEERIAELADSPKSMQSTMTNLESWARALREDVLDREAP